MSQDLGDLTSAALVWERDPSRRHAARAPRAEQYAVLAAHLSPLEAFDGHSSGLTERLCEVKPQAPEAPQLARVRTLSRDSALN